MPDDFRRRAFHQNGAIVEDIGAIDDIDRFPHVVVSDQHADIAGLEVGDESAKIVDCENGGNFRSRMLSRQYH